MAARFFISLLTLLSLSMASAIAQTANLASLVTGLSQANFKEKADLVVQIASSQDPKALPVLQLMLSGELYYDKDSAAVGSIEEAEGGVTFKDVVTDQQRVAVEKSAVKKITINNQLRGLLRSEIARISLSSDDADVRLSAIKEMLKDLQESARPMLQEAAKKESDTDVLNVINTGLAMLDLQSGDASQRLAALTVLGESLDPQVKAKIAELTEKSANGEYREQDLQVREAAKSALENIESNQAYYGTLETLFFGLSLGSVLLLAAIGLAITFGVMGVINMAHGELIMLGAYTTYVVQLLMPDAIDYSLFVAIPAAFVVAGLVGIAIERGVIRFLYGRPLETLLATFGISLILQQLVRTVFSPLNRSVETPSWMSGALEINEAFSITYNRLYIVIFSIIIFLLLLLLLKRTVFGLQMRAVTQNRAMARAMGVRSTWVDALTFGLGSGIAGVAGVALSQLTNVGPNMGQAYIIDSFMVVVFGGVGNLWGTLVGAFSLGIVNKFLEPWSGAVLAKILVLVFIILFIQKRPRGLFPQKGRNAEN